MGWTLDDVLDLDPFDYELLVNEINKKRL